MGQRALGVVASAINGAAGEYVRERQKRGDMRRKMALANYQKRLDGLDKSMEAQTQAEVDREFPEIPMPEGFYRREDGQLVSRQAELMRQTNSPPGAQGDPSGGGLGGPGYRRVPGISSGGGPQSIADRNRQMEVKAIGDRLNALLDDVQFERMDVDMALNEATKIGTLGDGKPHPNFKPITTRLKDIKKDREKSEAGDASISKRAGGGGGSGGIAVRAYDQVDPYNPNLDPSDYQGQFVGEGGMSVRPQPQAAQPQAMGAGGDVTAQQDTGMRNKTVATPDDVNAQTLYNENIQFRREVDNYRKDYSMSINDAIRAAFQARQQAQPAQRAQPTPY